MTRRKDTTKDEKDGGLEGILKGFSSILEKLGDLAETGEQLSRTGEIEFGKGGQFKGVYGFSVKVGAGGEGLKVEPFGNIKKDKKTGKSVVQEIREPLVDIFEEPDHVLIVAEMPGIEAEDIRLDIREDILTLTAENKDKKYCKEILLPGNFSPDKLTVACKNGVAEIRCNR